MSMRVSRFDAYIKILSPQLPLGTCPGQGIEGAPYRLADGTQAFSALERVCNQRIITPLRLKDKEVFRTNPGFDMV